MASDPRTALNSAPSSAPLPVLCPPLSRRERIAPWLEGAGLALLLMVVVALGGDSLRTSYHGTLHASLGEAVLRDGLTPENPYHAGEPLRYYLLYPALGALLGRTGMGPLWGFALLNLLAGLLLGPALDALGRALGLSFRARRFAFWWTILGLNGLGWLWASSSGGPLLDLRSLAESGEGVALGAMPLALLHGLASSPFGLEWDARLQSFLPKFLNVSSFALAIPFTLWALAFALRDGRRALFAAAAHVGVATALNPLAGGLAAVLLAARRAPTLRHPAAALRDLLPAAALATAIALPFLLPVLRGGGGGSEGASMGFNLAGDGALANLTGPLLLLWPLGIVGACALARDRRWFLAGALALALLLGAAPLPWGNEYKFVRLAALLLALPAGLACDRWCRTGAGLTASAALLLLAVPTTWLTLRAYSAWNAEAALVLTRVEDGRLAPAARFETAFPLALRTAERALPADAPLLADPHFNPSGLSSNVASGHWLAPLLHRALLVDRPQIHNEHAADLARRLEDWDGFVFGKVRPQARGEAARPADPAAALARLRAAVAGRPLAVLLDARAGAARALLQSHGAELRAQAEGLELWLLPPATAATGT
jgi:hypothetical protein